MKAAEFCKLAKRLMTKAAAPYFEHAVGLEVEGICDENDLAFEPDQYGNILVSLQTDASARPIAFAAHMDHPGFRLVRRLSPNRWLAQFRGGVPDSYFLSGAKVRLMPGAIRAELAGKLKSDRNVELQSRRGAVAHEPAFAVWDLPDFAARGGL